METPNQTQLPLITALTAKTALIAAQPKLTLRELKNSLILFSFNDLNGGDGGSRTRVQNKSNCSHSQAYQFLYPPTEWVDGYNLKLTVLLL